ncbi:anti-TRAP protein [Bacillus phage MrBubbles]|nr:anti-TRAP protein [Bacillus phage MrBubbles]
MSTKIKTEECATCGGSGFSGYGTGYDAVCDNCGGAGELPCYLKSKEC